MCHLSVHKEPNWTLVIKCKGLALYINQCNRPLVLVQTPIAFLSVFLTTSWLHVGHDIVVEATCKRTMHC